MARKFYRKSIIAVATAAALGGMAFFYFGFSGGNYDKISYEIFSCYKGCTKKKFVVDLQTTAIESIYFRFDSACDNPWIGGKSRCKVIEQFNPNVDRQNVELALARLNGVASLGQINWVNDGIKQCPMQYSHAPTSTIKYYNNNALVQEMRWEEGCEPWYFKFGVARLLGLKRAFFESSTLIIDSQKSIAQIKRESE